MTDGDDNDLALVQAWKRGDELATARLFSRHTERLRTFLRQGCASAREDLLQETLLIGLAQRDRLRSDAAFGPWLRGIARNLVRVHQRRSCRWESAELVDRLPCDAPSPFDRAAEQEALRRVEEALETLPDRERSFLTTYWTGDATIEKIARSVGAPSATMRKRLARGVGRLRAAIQVEEPASRSGARGRKS